MPRLNRHSARFPSAAISLTAGLAAVSACSLALAGTIDEPRATVTNIQTQRVFLRRIAHTAPVPPFQSRGPGCNQVVTSLATGFDLLDQGSEITLEAGMVELEGFGQEYIVPDPNPATPQNEAFPITINLIEFVVGTVGTISGSNGQNVNVGYTIDVYDGAPVAGATPVFSVSSTNDTASNPDLPADVSIQRLGGSACQPCADSNLSASVVKVQFSVDPGDPDQIVIQGNDQSGGVSTGRFTVMVRLTRMNDPTPYAACSYGLANQCGPLNRCNNGFMAVESLSTGALNYASRNWISIRSCGPFACNGGDYRFSQLNAQGGLSSACRPSRDTLLQTTYTPAVCTVANQGACCAAAGNCTITTSTACAGTYQGNGAICAPNPCPQPGTGACCINGACASQTESDCVGNGGVFQGSGSTCAGTTCPSSGGACCLGTIGCGPASPGECALINGVYQGNGTVCGPGSASNPPCGTGACCSTDGVCTAAITAAQCTAVAGRVYKGNDVACTTTLCPVPSGACCFANGACLERTSSQCASFSGTFLPGTCSPNPCPQPGVCCRGSTCAIGITQAGCTAVAPVGAFFAASGTACNTAANHASPCCYADFNKQAGISVQDIFDYLNAWFAVSPYCKINGDGATAPVVQDIFDFLNLWLAGGC